MIGAGPKEPETGGGGEGGGGPGGGVIGCCGGGGGDGGGFEAVGNDPLLPLPPCLMERRKTGHASDKY